GANHLVTIVLSWFSVMSDACGLFRGGVFGDLAEDPGIRGSCAADHDGVAACPLDHRRSVLGSADIAVADHRNVHCVFNGVNVFPAGVATVALLTSAGVKGNRV